MERTLIKNLRDQIGKEVQLQGWLQTLRDQKKMQFLVIRDHTGAAQVVSEKAADADLAAKISALTVELAITITGLVVDNPIVKLNGIEMQLKSVQVENLAGSPLPLDPFAEATAGYGLPSGLALSRPAPAGNRVDLQSADHRRDGHARILDQRWLPRDALPQDHGNSQRERRGTYSKCSILNGRHILSQSPQFYKQMAMSAGYDKVFEIAPVFRADPSFTSRHMTEFTGVDVEISWIESHEDVMKFHEEWLQYVYQRVKEIHGDEIKDRMGLDIVVPETPFPRLNHERSLCNLESTGLCSTPRT